MAVCQQHTASSSVPAAHCQQHTVSMAVCQQHAGSKVLSAARRQHGVTSSIPSTAIQKRTANGRRPRLPPTPAANCTHPSQPQSVFLPPSGKRKRVLPTESWRLAAAPEGCRPQWDEHSMSKPQQPPAGQREPRKQYRTQTASSPARPSSIRVQWTSLQAFET